MTTITISIPLEILTEITQESKNNKIKKSRVVQKALERYFDDELETIKEKIDELKEKLHNAFSIAEGEVIDDMTHQIIDGLFNEVGF